MLPYRTGSGPLLVGACGRGSTYALSWTVGTGPWHRFATLELSEDQAVDVEITFDAVRHQVPGLEQYPVVVRLREPAYRSARRARNE